MKPMKAVDKELLLIQEWYTNSLKCKYRTILLTLITVHLLGLNLTLIWSVSHDFRNSVHWG